MQDFGKVASASWPKTRGKWLRLLGSPVPTRHNLKWRGEDMLRRPLPERLLHAAYTAETRDFLTLILERLPVLHVLFLFGILLVSASNLNQLVIAIGGILLYGGYASFWNYLSAGLSLETSSQWRLARSVVAIALIAFGLSLVGRTETALWLLFVIPLWRIAEYHEANGRVFVSILALELLLLAVTTWQAWRDEPISQIVTRVASRTLWLSFFAFQISQIVRFVKYVDEGTIMKQQAYHSLLIRLFQVGDFRKWCDLVARYCLNLTRASYCTIQTCDYKNDNLRMEVALSALGLKRGESVQLDLCKDRMGLLDMKFIERQDGITSRVAHEGTAIWLPDVRRTEYPYREFFPQVRSEIAVPIFDFARGAPVGVINVEYTDEDSPQSAGMLGTYAIELEEVAHTVGAAYSYSLVSIQSEAMHTLMLKLSSLATEDDLLQTVVQGLSSLYQCPVAVWLPVSQHGSSFVVPRAFTDDLPQSWAHDASKPRIKFGAGPLHPILMKEDVVFISDIGGKAVTHWRTYAKLGLQSVLIAPIPSGTSERGMIEICTRTQYEFLPYEVRLIEQLAVQVGYEMERMRLATEAVEEMLQQPVTAMVHDVRAPVNRIPAIVDMIEQSCQLGTPSCHEALAFLREESSYLESIGQLMPIQIKFGLSGTIPTERLDVCALLEQTIELITKRGLIKEEQVKWYGARGPVYVECNRVIAAGLFNNLALNAARAIRKVLPKKESLGIAIIEHRGSESAFLKFANSSSKLPSQVLERLSEFQPILEKDRSGGFGLATYARLVSAMGGRLEVDSTRPWGLVFQVVLPLSKEA